MPRITTITIAWNAARTIADTMASVAAQDFPDHEHIIIDGASTDETVAIVKSLATARTRIISEPDKGLYDAMNKGLALASGDYVGFLNADDFYIRTDALSLLVAATQQDCDAVSAAVAIVDEHNPEKWIRSYSATHFRPWMLRFGHMPPHPGFYVARHLIDQIGRFDTSYRIAGDFDWLVRFFQAGYRPRPVRETLVALREGGASNSGLASRRTIATETARALATRGIGTVSALLWMKYAAKAAQYLLPPHAFPAPEAFRWYRPDNQTA